MKGWRGYFYVDFLSWLWYNLINDREVYAVLIDDIVDFCDKKYSTYGNKCGCGKCNHPSKNCSGCCYNCLYQVHFPARFNSEPIKKLYDCPKMIYHYVCQYSFLYATELLCAYREETSYLTNCPYYHTMSLGCGGCADLMAFEQFYKNIGVDAPISYIGIDVNELQRPVNNRIQKYCEKENIKYKVQYYDVFKCFRRNGVVDANILVISYLISYLYNTKQISTINTFVEDVVNNIVQKKKTGQKFLIIINDVNSNLRGRDYFDHFIGKLNEYQLSIINCKYKYFDTGDLYQPQKIGTPYAVQRSLFPVPNAFGVKYHAQERCQKTIQLILEVI